MKKIRKNKFMYLFLIVILIIIILFFIKLFVKGDYYKLSSRLDKINSYKVDDSYALGWIRVQGSDIDTPIISVTSLVSADLKADYLWTSSYYEEKENRKVIYGHNIRNVSNEPDIVNKEHIRFEQLLSFVYYDFAKDNLYIQYTDGEDEALYKIYAVSFNDSSEEYGFSYSVSEVGDYIKRARENSLYKYDIDVNQDDEIISLVTCTRYFGAYEKTQFRIDARRVRRNEKINKYSVEITSNYDIIK